MDSLLSKSVWIFIGIVLLVILPSTLPTPVIIGICLLLGSSLVLLQTYIILKDDGEGR